MGLFVLRKAQITLGGKEFEMQEIPTNIFLEMGKFAIDKYKEASGFGELMTSIIEKYLPQLIPGATKDDLLKSYPSELERLVETFKDLNFTSVMKMVNFIGAENTTNIVKALFGFVSQYVQEVLKDAGLTKLVSDIEK
jgi:hypothetical protein